MRSEGVGRAVRAGWHSLLGTIWYYFFLERVYIKTFPGGGDTHESICYPPFFLIDLVSHKTALLVPHLTPSQSPIREHFKFQLLTHLTPS